MAAVKIYVAFLLLTFVRSNADARVEGITSNTVIFYV